MYIYNIVVRWCSNGDLEGFGASALTKDAALKRAKEKAYRKASSFSGSSGFDVLTSAEYEALPAEVQDELQADWDAESL